MVEAHHRTPEQIGARLNTWEDNRRKRESMSSKDAVAALMAPQRNGKPLFTVAQIDEKLGRLTFGGAKAGPIGDPQNPNENSKPEVEADYYVLQALNHLDAADKGIDLSDKSRVANARAILQAAEIAILNSIEIARRTADDIQAARSAKSAKLKMEKLGAAEEKYRWFTSYQEALFSLSTLLSEMTLAGEGYQTGISSSPHINAFTNELNRLHTEIESVGGIKPEAIRNGHLYEPLRNISHQAFVDANHIEKWQERLQTINLPGVQPDNGETGQDFYKRFVGTDRINLAVNEIDQIDPPDNFMRQFRSWHQMSERLVQRANSLIADSARIIISSDPNRDLRQVTDNMNVAISMLRIVDQNLSPIARNLSFNQYIKIRELLGITSGSHSPNIMGLFKTMYPSFTDSVIARVAPNGNLEDEMKKIIANPTKDDATYQKYQLLQQALQLHSAIRSWRAMHIQFPETEIGLSPEGEAPASSISGSEIALKSTHDLSRGGHGVTDPIKPIYEALLGKKFEPIPPFKEAFRGNHESTFSDKALASTAEAGRKPYSDVNARAAGGRGHAV